MRIGAAALILILAATLTAESALAEGRIDLVVGQHRSPNNENRSGHVADILNSYVYTIAEELGGTRELRNHVEGHVAQNKEDVPFAGLYLRREWENNASALLVVGGIYVVDDKATDSIFFIGNETDGFEVRSISARIQNRESYPVDRKLVNLSILYAMIREAKARKLDWKKFISPMRQKAIGIAGDIPPVTYPKAKKIADELKNLKK